MRRVIAFPCTGATLLGTLDDAAGATGVLIVSGGNEVRAGTHRGMATLALDLAARGLPVFRYDRRGVGDSSGDNMGWEGSGPDIAAAAAAFRREQPHLTRVVGFGICDAATALALFGRDAGLDALILANPWLGDDGAAPPPDALRRHYRGRLLDPAAWRRMLAGRIAPARLARSLLSLARPRQLPLARRWRYSLPSTVILAEGDRTAQLFRHGLRGTFAGVRLVALATASHSFADAGEALAAAIYSAASASPSNSAA